MKIVTTLPHRANRAVSFPPPVGVLQFDENCEVEVSAEHAAILLATSSDTLALVDQEDGEKLPEVIVEIPEDNSRDMSNVPADDDGSNDGGEDVEIAKIKKMNVTALRQVCEDMGLEEGEWKGLTRKNELVDYLVGKLK